MKKKLILSILAAIAVVFPLGAVHAQTEGVVLGATSSASQAVVTTPKPDAPVEPLTIRKQKAETSLRAIHGQFALFATRTQLAIDRLATKGIDVTTAQTELTATTTVLATTKTDLDLFATITVTDDMSEKDTVQVKVLLKKIEDGLKDARTHLINSLTALKASVPTQ